MSGPRVFLLWRLLRGSELARNDSGNEPGLSRFALVQWERLDFQTRDQRVLDLTDLLELGLVG